MQKGLNPSVDYIIYEIDMKLSKTDVMIILIEVRYLV